MNAFGPSEFERFGEDLDALTTEPVDGQKKGAIVERTKRDWFIEQYLKIRTKRFNRAEQSKQGEFRLNNAQKAYSRLCRKNKSQQNIVLKARQVGITTYVAARFFVQTITRRGTVSMQVTHNRESAEDIFRIVRRFLDRLPEGWHEGKGAGKLRTSHCNVRQIVFPELDSEYCIASADENAGRGRTIHNLHCSEVSRWDRHADETLAALRAAVVPDGDIVLESTPNGASGLFYDEWLRADETGYTKHFFPWWFDEGYVVEPAPTLGELTEEEQQLKRDHDLSDGQIAWRRKQWAALRGYALQEFAEDPISCFRESGECVFDLASVEHAARAAGSPVETRDNHRLLVWMPPEPNRGYIVGVDPAGGGVDGDYCCAQVIDRELGVQCAELHGHYPPRELAHEIADLARKYNTALLAVERNNHGHAVLAWLENLYPRVYRQHDQAGWLTSTVTRPTMIEGLSKALMDAPELFRSERLLTEFRTFIRDRDGNTGAAPSTHDDCVMAMAIAWEVRKAEAGRN